MKWTGLVACMGEMRNGIYGGDEEYTHAFGGKA
jgi:hypothetical protein